jgi:DNA repair photolyase
VQVRSALARTTGMPFDWALNPYRGCTHACEYCYARKYQRHLELGAGDDFSSVIFVKVNLLTVLRRELSRPGWTRESVSVGTATDPYQPIEGHYKLTRRCLEALHAARTPVGIVTKGPMIVRDADVLAALGRAAGCTVCVSVPTVDEEAWAALEPGTAHPLQRLRAVRQLREAGVNAGVLMAPVVPGFTTQPARLEATIKAVAEHGAAFMGASVMYLKGGTRDHFMGFLAERFPHMVAGYQRLYAGAYAPPGYVTAIEQAIGKLQRHHDLGRRTSRVPSQASDDPALNDEKAAREQAAFEWSDTGA